MRIRLTVAIIITTLLMALVAPAVRVSAKESDQQYTVLRVIKDNAAVRQENHNKGKVITKAAFGSLLYGVEKKASSKQTLWWKLADGNYIFDGNVEDTGVKTSLPNKQHICNGTIKSVVGNAYCAMGDGKNHYRTMTYDMLCVCGACVSSTNYEIFEEPCDYELGLTSGICKFCQNTESSAAIITNNVVTGTGNFVKTLGAEMTSSDNFEKTADALLKGENAKEQTATAVVLETSAALVGGDILFDLRDLTNSITNFSKNSKEDSVWKAIGAIGFNAVCLLPVVGCLKSADKVTNAVKAAEKAGDISSSIKSIKKVEKAVGVVDVGATAAKVADKADSVTDAAKTADAIADSAQTGAKVVDRTVDVTDNTKEAVKHADVSGANTPTPGFDDWLNKGNADNKVYFGIDNNGTPQYTGITRQAADVRLNQHKANGKQFADLEIQYSELTRNQARALEQYHIKNGPNAWNKINSIGPNNKYRDDAIAWAEKYLGK